MSFELSVVSNTPLTALPDADSVALAFLQDIGYLPRTFGASGDADGVRANVPFRLFAECFLRRPEKGWTVEELMVYLDTSRPTVYRHLNKLKSLDILEEATMRGEGPEGQSRKTYRVRYGNFSKAWNFVEAHVKVAMENYRKSVDHLHEISLRQAKTRGGMEE